MVCMRNDGKLSFGASSGGQQTAVTPAAYNDGAWHHVVATQGAGGMKLYVDGIERATNPTTGGGELHGLLAGRRRPLLDRHDEQRLRRHHRRRRRLHQSALPASVVGAHYMASGRTLANQAPTARIVASTAFLTATLDGTTSSDPDGTIASYAWTFGDGSTSTAPSPSHLYAAAGTYPVTLTVTDDSGATAIASTTVTVVANQAPSASFTRRRAA